MLSQVRLQRFSHIFLILNTFTFTLTSFYSIMTTRSTLEDLQNRPKWTQLADLPIPLCGHAAVALDENRAIICGGLDDASRSVDSVFIYDKTTMTTTSLPTMNQEHFHHAAAIASNKMFVIGGRVDGIVDTVEVLDLETT